MSAAKEERRDDLKEIKEIAFNHLVERGASLGSEPTDADLIPIVGSIFDMGWLACRDFKDTPMSGTALDLSEQITIRTLEEAQRKLAAPSPSIDEAIRIVKGTRA